MDDLSTLIDRYVAVWNEADPPARRRRIAAVWAPDGTTCHRLLDAHGYEAIESRVAGSWDRWLCDGRYVFRAVSVVSHHRAIKLNFAMLATESGRVEANGLSYLLVDEDGRIVHDYQFNPTVHDAAELAVRYSACRDEAGAARRRGLIAELWAENGAFFNESVEAQGRDELANAFAAAQRERIAKGLVSSAADRSQQHHNVAHIARMVVGQDNNAVDGAMSTLLIVDNEGRITAAYEFNESLSV
jgi:hypothetical protein